MPCARDPFFLKHAVGCGAGAGSTNAPCATGAAARSAVRPCARARALTGIGPIQRTAGTRRAAPRTAAASPVYFGTNCRQAHCSTSWTDASWRSGIRRTSCARVGRAITTVHNTAHARACPGHRFPLLMSKTDANYYYSGMDPNYIIDWRANNLRKLRQNHFGPKSGSTARCGKQLLPPPSHD